ncbi:MAG: hypothetical protein A2341_07665 [Deltaproteobacteria bacterium RIFOXYB12_FULL_58_9]|nr:MAG: hypothetical protein A2341_07665 [Deltaproteobacteria bacterium RIFOXYB12_FULL_58_9]
MGNEPQTMTDLHDLRERSHREREQNGWTYQEYLAQVRDDGGRLGEQLCLRRILPTADVVPNGEFGEEEGNGASV